MIHEATGSATTYFGVDLDVQTLPDGTRRGFMSTVPLAETVARAVPDVPTAIGWYWTQGDTGERRVWFLRREHAEAFRRFLTA